MIQLSRKGGLLALLKELNTEHLADCRVLEHAYGLNQLEADAYFMLQDKHLTAEQLAAALKRDRSTVQRALGTLIDLNLIHRETKTLTDQGKKGYYYIYTAFSIDVVRQRISSMVREVTTKLNRFVENEWCIPKFETSD